MTKTFVASVAVAVALAAVLAGGVRWCTSDDRPGCNTRATAAAIDGAHVEGESAGTPATMLSDDVLASAMVQASRPTELPEAQPRIAETASALGSATSDPTRYRSEAAAVVPLDPEAIDPDSVIGRPFPLSPSVRTRGCELVRYCDWLEENLAGFEQQPRDLQWASEMEAKLRNFFMAHGDKYTIRAIECRTSMCLVEVASIHGLYHGYIPYGDPLSKQMLHRPVEFGYERDPSSARLTITVASFRKR